MKSQRNYYLKCFSNTTHEFTSRYGQVYLVLAPCWLVVILREKKNLEKKCEKRKTKREMQSISWQSTKDKPDRARNVNLFVFNPLSKSLSHFYLIGCNSDWPYVYEYWLRVLYISCLAANSLPPAAPHHAVAMAIIKIIIIPFK